MGIRDRVPSWLSGRDDGVGYVRGHAPSDAPNTDKMVYKGDSDRAATQRKQDPIRTATLPPRLARQVERRDGAMKPYDIQYMKDLGANWVSEAYIDTMAQDAATAPWGLEPRDDATDVEDDAVAEAERFLQQIHPEKSFRDLREIAARNTLRLGDGAWVKHYTSAGELAEVVPVDSARLFKKVDDHGLTEGYIQASFSRLEVDYEFDLEEVVWFEWSSRTDHVYGEGPVEKAKRLIEILEELNEKERKDLEEGMPPGIVSVKEDEDTPLATDAYETVRDQWELEEGQRHRAIVSMGDWQFTPLDSGYQELQFMERIKLWIQSLGAVFKVNAPYAGFDFQEGNKAQNEAQVEAAKQRGFRVLLRQMEEAINRQLIWPDINEDLEFSFEDAQSIDEREAEAQHLQTLAQAAEDWDALGRDVTLRDGSITVEDGPVETPEDDGGDDGGMADLFGSAGVGKEVDTTPPQDVAQNAQAARDLKEEHGNPEDCGTQTGWTRSAQLADREQVSEETINRMVSFLSRHLAQAPSDLSNVAETDCQRLMIQAWGGKEGLRWAEEMQEQFAAEAEKSTADYLLDTRVAMWGKASPPRSYLISPCKHAGVERPAKDDELEDACWEGYEAVGFKIDENGNKVPNCVPEEEVENAKDEDELEDACWEGYEAVGFKIDENGNKVPDCVPIEEVEGEAKSTEADTLTKTEAHQLDELLLSAHRTQIQPESHEDIEKRSWGDDADVPQFVIDKIKDVIDSGAVFADIEGVPDRTIERVEQILEDSLSQPQGWSLDSIIQRFKDTYPGVPEEQLAVIARTETASILNQAREEGYEDIPSEEEPHFYWTGPEDSRTTPTCTADSVDGVTGLKGRTNPNHGGTPVRMGELIRQEEELQKIHHPDLRFRKHVPHINCRHTFVRYVEGQFDE